jgi:hypothetical protein
VAGFHEPSGSGATELSVLIRINSEGLTIIEHKNRKYKNDEHQ